ncbi:YkvI family membrane protein [Halobacillus mangrovi]|uniref:YkvI family membrane protein n=1 Tax=Halobacillus mangrovi TaxID=402384 RepID=UPI003D975412
MKKIIKIASAFVGIIVGAGFASGQEILQYFTSFGYIGTIGTIIATALFAYMGMMLTKLGTRMKAKSHKEAVYRVSGRYLGIIVDYVIIFTLFGVGVVMIAGAGSIPSQQFGLPPVFGIILMSVIVMATIMMNVGKVVNVIGSITPFLIVMVVMVSIYSLTTMDLSFSSLQSTAVEQPKALSNWFVSALNYVSFNVAVGASMSLLMGGNEEDERTSAIGGLLGGLTLGLLIVLSHLAIFSKVDVVASFDMPMLKLVDDISPALGIFYSIILFGMVFNTAVSMFFSFAARFTKVGTSSHKKFVLITGIIAFGLSFVGFTELVAIFYPLIGFLGLFLIVALISAPFRLKAEQKKHERLSA